MIPKNITKNLFLVIYISQLQKEASMLYVCKMLLEAFSSSLKYKPLCIEQ